MEIRVLGTRGEIEESAPYHAKHSGILINNKLLLDCGDKRFLRYKPKIILITHLHPDHAYFVREKETPHIKIPLYAPEQYEEMPIQVKKKPFKVAGYTITPIATKHSAKVKSTAYLIQHKKKKILYTGDMIAIDKKYYSLFKNLDLVITEASFIRKGGLVKKDTKRNRLYGHIGIPDLIKLFKPFTHTILFVHFGAWFYKDMKKARKKFEKLAKEQDMKLIVGYDGLELKV